MVTGCCIVLNDELSSGMMAVMVARGGGAAAAGAHAAAAAARSTPTTAAPGTHVVGVVVVVVMRVVVGRRVVGVVMRGVMRVMRVVVVVGQRLRLASDRPPGLPVLQQAVLGGDVVIVADGEFLTLVARQANQLAHVGSDLTLVAALAQQRVDGLDTVPTYPMSKSGLRTYF